MRRVADGICLALRCTAELVYTPVYPVTVNEPEVTGLMRSAASEIFGEENVVEVPIAMGSEDFSYFGEKVPAAYVFLGIADETKGTHNQHHTPRFNVNDDVLADGAALLAAFADGYTCGE